jgi:nitrile hydratase
VDGIHDLGGRHGFGGSLTERREQGFHADWERRVFGINLLLLGQGCFSIDAMRHAFERIEPVTYLSAGYYGRWLIGTEMLIAEAGGRPRPGSVADTTARRTLSTAPRFPVGSAQGAWVLPDTNAHGRGECPEHVYAVRFAGRELWGEDAEPDTCVHLDLFES